MADVLSTLLVKAKDLVFIGGFQAGHDGEVISHLRFTNITIVFCYVSREEVITLKRILRCLQLVLGLKVHLSKSSLAGVRCSKKEVSR